MTKVTLEVNGKKVSKDVPDHTILSIFLRDNLNLTGTHVGCDTSQCGACVVHVNGKSIKSCSTLAADVDGSKITTIEGLVNDGKLPNVGGFDQLSKSLAGINTVGVGLTNEALKQGLIDGFLKCYKQQSKLPSGIFSEFNKSIISDTFLGIQPEFHL